MEIKLLVSDEKNFKKLDKLKEDPIFIYSILRLMGFEECPNLICLQLGIIKNKQDKKSVSDSNINDK